MHDLTVEVATAALREKALQTITLGFIADPVCRWVWPDASIYLETMPKFAAAFAGKAFEHGSAFVVDGCRAAGLWLPPLAAPDDTAIEALFETTVGPRVLGDLVAVFEKMESYHPKDRPYWYLPLIAADPAFMGRGLGAAILRHALALCDRDGAIAYLEGTSPRNVGLYERHGFEVVGKIQAGTSPTLYPMIREPRA